jgi:hypothetical protein
LGQNGADSAAKEWNAFHREWNAFHRIGFRFLIFSVATPSNPIPNYPDILSFQKEDALPHPGTDFAFPYLKEQSKSDKSPLS